jgi:hypothetical protein
MTRFSAGSGEKLEDCCARIYHGIDRLGGLGDTPFDVGFRFAVTKRSTSGVLVHQPVIHTENPL